LYAILFFSHFRYPLTSTLFPYTTLFRSTLVVSYFLSIRICIPITYVAKTYKTRITSWVPCYPCFGKVLFYSFLLNSTQLFLIAVITTFVRSCTYIFLKILLMCFFTVLSLILIA